jgi:hypothetical protein
VVAREEELLDEAEVLEGVVSVDVAVLGVDVVDVTTTR